MRDVPILVLAAVAMLGACSPGGSAGGGAQEAGGKYAGLEDAIRDWRADIVKADAACQAKGGQGCESFEVGCKGEQEIGPDDQARGVAAKVVVAMTWSAYDAARAEARPASGFAEFRKAGGSWSRSEARPVNIATCAPQ